jgi:epsilon-lactone hydrolase
MSIDDASCIQPIREDQRRPQALPLTDTGPSWQSRWFNILLGRLPAKKQLASAAAVQARVRKLAQQPASYEPAGLGRDMAVTLKKMLEWPVYYTALSSNPNVADYVVFLHGGGFINEIVPTHWRFVDHLTRHACVRCVVPIYPLAPGATANELVPTTGRLLQMLRDEAGSAKITVIGNSAGAGLGVAAAQWLRDSGYQQPDGLVLISPAVNLSVGDAARVTIAARDPLQDVPGVLELGRLYAGKLDITHPYVSPLYGDLHGLAPMIVFSGTRDLLYPDSVDLAAKARAAGVKVELHLRQDQPHNYACLPTPEGEQARATIIRALHSG